MFNPTTLVAEALGRHLAETYDRRFGGREPEYGRILESAARFADSGGVLSGLKAFVANQAPANFGTTVPSL